MGFMEINKKQAVVVSVFVVLISITIFGFYSIFASPEPVTEPPINVEDRSKVDSNYLGNAYVVTLAGDSNETFQYSLNENYKRAEYELEVYYTNNTGLHTETSGLGGGGGSSSVASYSESFELEVSDYEPKTQELTSSRYAMALVHFDGHATIKDGKVRGISGWKFIGIFSATFGSVLLVVFTRIVYSVRKDN